MNNCNTCKFDPPKCPWVMKTDMPPVLCTNCSDWVEFDISIVKKEIKELKDRVKYLERVLGYSKDNPPRPVAPQLEVKKIKLF